jgi:nitrogen-specific signal transduction histidine kinase
MFTAGFRTRFSHMESTGLNFKTLFELISQPVIVADSQLNLLFSNKSALSLLDTQFADLQAKPLSEHFQFPQDKMNRVRELLLSREKESLSCFFLHNENELTPLRITIQGIPLPVKDRVGYYIELFKADIDHLTEDEIKRLGFKTSQIAHEFSNPLSVLKIQCENFAVFAEKQKQLRSQDVIERIKTMSKATDRLNITNTELKKLSQSLANIDMNEIHNMIGHSDKGDQH